MKIPKIKSPYELIFGREIREEKRVRLSSRTKNEVYERSHRICQCCGRPLKINQGEFHHLRKPNVNSRPSTIQFLCPTCHKTYGHEWKPITKRNTLGQPVKVSKLRRKRVRKHPSSPYWKEKPKKKTTKTKQRRKSKTTSKKRSKTKRKKKKSKGEHIPSVADIILK